MAETTREGETDLLTGTSVLEERLECAGETLRFRISPDAFFQTNTEMAELLYAAALEFAGLSGRERVFDLFSGIGTIALALAPAAGEVWGIEVVERAVADAIENASLNGIDNARFYAGDVRTRAAPAASSRPERPTSSWWTRLAPGCPRRWCGGSSRPAPRALCTCRAIPPRSRQMPVSWWTAAIAWSASGRSTCFRRRLTSSASPRTPKGLIRSSISGRSVR